MRTADFSACDCLSRLLSKLQAKENALIDEKFKELTEARTWQGLNRDKIVRIMTEDAENSVEKVAKKFDEALLLLQLNEETRKKYDPDEIRQITQVVDNLKAAYLQYLTLVVETRAKSSLSTPISPEELKILESCVEKILILASSLDPIRARIGPMRSLFSLKSKIQTGEAYFKHSTFSTIDAHRNQAIQDARDFILLYKELFPNERDCDRLIESIKQCYESILKEKRGAYLYATQFNLDEFPDLLDSAATFEEARELAGKTLSNLTLSESPRAFLTAEEVQQVENLHRACEEAYIDWVLGYLARNVENSVHPIVLPILAHYVKSHPDLPMPRQEYIKAVIEKYGAAREQLRKIRGVTFNGNDVENTYRHLSDYLLAIQKLLYLHTELFPEQLNPWEEELAQRREQAQEYLITEGGLAIAEAFSLNTRSTPLFTEYPPEGSLANLLKGFQFYVASMSALKKTRREVGSEILNDARRILKQAYNQWVDRCIAHHQQKSLDLDHPNAIEELHLPLLILQMTKNRGHSRGDIIFASKSALALLDKLKPILQRNIPYNSIEEYFDQCEKLIDICVKKKLVRLEPGVKIVNGDRYLEDPHDRTIYVEFRDHFLFINYRNPVNGYSLISYKIYSSNELHARFQERRRLIQIADEISDWEAHPQPSRAVFRSVSALPISEKGAAERFVVIFIPDRNEFVMVNNKSRMTYAEISSRVISRVKNDDTLIPIVSLRQFEEVQARLKDQEQTEKLDQEFVLSEKALRTISPASILDLPPMPTDLIRSRLTYCLELLRSINFTNPKQKNYHSPMFEGHDLRQMVKKLVQFVKGRLEYYGIPKNDSMKKKWYDRFEAMLRQSILIMRERFDGAPLDKKAEVLRDNQTMVLEIGKFVQFCGARWITELNTIYRILSGRMDQLFVGDMPTIMHKILDDLKTGILNAMANETPSTVVYQSSHGLIYYMQALARLNYTIPQAELADYEDVYDAQGKSGKYKTDQEVEKGFKAHLKASTGIGLIHTTLNERMVTESRENILIALRTCIKTPPAGLAQLRKEQANELKKVQTQLDKESALSHAEKQLFIHLSTLQRNAFIIGQTEEMKTFRAQIKALIANKPSYVLAFAKQLDDQEFNAQKSKEIPLTESENAFLKAIQQQSALTHEDKQQLTQMAASKPCQLAIHECGGQEIYAKIGKEPYCRPDLINRFGLNVVPFKTQLDALKEQHASQIAELLDEQLLNLKFLRKETRMLKKPKSDELVPQEVLLLTVEGTMELLRPTGLLDTRR
jgi:hypothetical protein